MLMKQTKMDQLVRFRKNVEHVQGLLEKIEQGSLEFTQDDGLTFSYVQELKLYGGAPLRMIKMLHMRVSEIEAQQNGRK